MFTGFYFRTRLRVLFCFVLFLSRWVGERYRYLYMRRSLFERERRVVTFVFFSWRLFVDVAVLRYPG